LHREDELIFVAVRDSSVFSFFFLSRLCDENDRTAKQPVEKGKNMKKAHFLSNADTAMNFLRSKQVKITTTTTKKRNTQK
jgi:AAA15 family ATPase/GTPase